jgi:hypothetical protein
MGLGAPSLAIHAGTVTVEYFDGQQTRTTTYNETRARTGFPANQRGAPPISASKWATWAAWAATAGVGTAYGAGLLVALYPSSIGDGTLQDFCQGNATCLATGYPQCEILPGCGTFGWVNVPCSQETGGAVSVRREEPTSGTYCPLESYPEDTGWGWLINVLPSEAGSLWDQLAVPGTITPDQANDIADAPGTGMLDVHPGQEHPFGPGATVVPDIWEPLPMPEEIPANTPAEVMNPNGYPAEGEGVQRNPVEFPQVTPWPSGSPDTWPENHPSPSPTVNPDGSPRTDPGASTGTQTVNVNFPDRLDARIVDTDIVVDAEDSGPLDETEINVLGMLDAGAGWLPRNCPDFSVDMMGQTLVFGSSEFCGLLTNIGFLLLAMTTIGALRYGLGGM